MQEAIKNILRPFIPVKLLQARRLKNLSPLVEEINQLGVKKSGFDNDGTPWVEVSNGKKFFGLKPTSDESFIYKIIENEIDAELIPHDCFGVVYEIISRYNAPRSIPGELFGSSSRFDPMRDPINDFDLEASEREAIARRFQPKKGDVVLDIGACHGFGTMRLAEYVGKTGKVIAVEANPISANILRKNIDANQIQNIQLIEIAVSNYKTSGGVFYMDGVATGNSLRADVLQGLGINSLSELNIDITTGDDILKKMELTKIQYLNITVNGGEPEVIDGLKKTIQQSDKLAITMPGWYFREGKRLDSLLARQLLNLGFENIKTGSLGRIIAWR